MGMPHSSRQTGTAVAGEAGGGGGSASNTTRELLFQNVMRSAYKAQRKSKNDCTLMKEKRAKQGTMGKKLLHGFRKLDMFGQNVSLTWNG